MLGLISSHLQASLIATGKLSLMLKQEDLITILEDSMYHHTLQSIEKGVSFEIDASYRPLVRIDVAYIQDVFTQLLENALKLSMQGSTISIRIEENAKSVRTVVNFEKAEEDNSLNEFDDEWNVGSKWNLDSAMNRNFKTSLPVLRQVVKHHGGMIWITKHDQSPSTNYIVELPLAHTQAWNRMA